MDMNFAKRTVTTLTAAAICLMGVPAVMPELADTVMMMASAEKTLTYGCLTDVYYMGTETQWNAIEIGMSNGYFTNATIHFNATAPTETMRPSAMSVVITSDAAIVLITAAQIGAGDTSNLTEAQRKAADVNKDEKINASDTAVILMYTAAVGAGDKDVKIEDFVANTK